MSMLVFVFGDSIAWGLYDDRGEDGSGDSGTVVHASSTISE